MLQNQENMATKDKDVLVDHWSQEHMYVYQFLHRKSCRINVSVIFRELISRGQMNLDKMLGIIQNDKCSAKLRGSMICVI